MTEGLRHPSLVATNNNNNRQVLGSRCGTRVPPSLNNYRTGRRIQAARRVPRCLDSSEGSQSDSALRQIQRRATPCSSTRIRIRIPRIRQTK
ncbi:hypothetical protein E2C01_023303 [Portunus trituberculatus]|uniref:Uncharacterized protein n=1 Tax=Portunus trituberculatus TaxID=210409 RepID=A0A5B7E9G0_PORTR|nr:hypothetical protein [Portunus trituberculatus]